MATATTAWPLVSKLQAALTVGEVQQAYVSAVGDVIFARGRGLYRVDRQTQAFIDQIADVPEPLLVQYASLRLEDDPVLRTAIATKRPVASSEHGVVSTWSGSRAHAVLLKFGYSHSLKAPLVVRGTLWGSVHFTRSITDPPFDENDKVASALVVEHLGIALTRALRHEETAQRANSLEAALNCVPEPVVVTDHVGRQVLRNRAADLPSTDDRAPIGDLVHSKISQAMELLALENRRVVLGTVDCKSGEPMSIRTVAIRGQGGAVTVVYAKGSGVGRALPALGILSPREQEIAQFVSEGLSTDEIASRAFITVNTVKQHLKRIFTKLDVRSRAELVQYVWAAAAAATSANTQPDPS